jgi:hypothetical protein
MKKWIESWLIPLVNKYADTPMKRRVAWSIIFVIGASMSWFGASLTRISSKQLIIMDQTHIGQGVIK